MSAVHGLLRSVWQEPRPPDPPVRVWRDWALAVVVVALAVLEGVLRPDLPWRPLSMIITIGLVPTLLWRRTRPFLVVVIAFGVTSAVPFLVGGDISMYTTAFLLILMYSLVRWGSGRESVVGLALVLAGAVGSLVRNGTALSDVIGATAVMFSAVALGGTFRYRARARTRELDQVKLLEREQLARDLHDTVAHHVSAMAIRAQAGLATSASHPEAATEALRLIEAEASRTLAEMRGMVRVLRRNEPGDLAPGRRIEDLKKLASETRFGPSVEVEVSGDLDDLPPSVGAAIYRIAQESVTNARRHARRATRIEVRVVADDTSVRLRVRDDGETVPAWRCATRGGSGRGRAS
jgi:signal transduction histidine kinase